MSYVFDVNRTIVGAAEAIFRWKELLKTAGWTVTKSSDGTTYNASGDQITTYTSGAGGMDNSRAWFVIRQPTGATPAVRRELCVQRNSANSSDWRIKYSYSVGFGTGSPAATVTPDATDEAFIYGSGTSASPNFTQLNANNTTTRFHAFADNAAPHGFGFWVHDIGLPGNRRMCGVMDPLTSALVDDPDPVIFYWTNNGNQFLVSGANQNSMAGVSANGGGPLGWVAKGVTNVQAFTNTPACHFVSCAADTSSNQTAWPATMSSNPFNGKDDEIPLLYIRSRTYSFPHQFKGISTTVRMNGILRSDMETKTISTDRDRVIVGNCSLPWNGSVPII